MRKRFPVLGVVCVIALTAGIWALSNRAAMPAPSALSSLAESTRATPADRQIHKAEVYLKTSPAKPDGYNLLAAAYMQKARETGDFGFYARAEAALNRSLKAAADNFTAVILRATLLLANHRFSEALDTARRAEALHPDSPDVYGAMTDALVELGEYEAAIEAAQKMMNLRPDTASYARVSHLRALHGDTEGAVEAMRVAISAADQRDPERAAWCLVQLGRQLLNAGQPAEAEQAFDSALAVFPDFYLALAAKAEARAARGDASSATEFYKQAQQRVPLPDTAIALGDLYTKLGLPDEAKRQYDLVEFIERAGSAAGTYSRQLVLFWADHDIKLDEALAIARRERRARSDIYTCDALAWCLFKRGELSEARAVIGEALRLGTRDARIYYHAGMIYDGLGDRQKALGFLKLALTTNPFFDVMQAETAKQRADAIIARSKG